MIRPGRPDDAPALARQMHALWPDGSLEEHAAEAAEILAGRPPTTLPLVFFVAEEEGAVVGFVEVDLRSHADGCDPRRPVGYLEGWWVDAAFRGRGIGGALVRAAEAWAREEGAVEMASDTWIDNDGSVHAHEKLGYEIVDRCVHFRKKL